MSTDFAGRPVLRPAGNVAIRANLKQKPKQKQALAALLTKPPPLPARELVPSTPKSRSLLLLKPSTKHPPCSPTPSPHTKLPPPSSPCSAIVGSSDGASSDDAADVLGPPLDDLHGSSPRANQDVDGSIPALCLDQSSVHASSPAPCASRPSPTGSEESFNESECIGNATRVLRPSQNVSYSPPITPQAPVLNPQQAVIPHSSLTKFHQRTTSHGKTKAANNKYFSKFGSLSFDESCLATKAAAKKAAAHEGLAQRKLKVAEHGRKQGKLCRVAPDTLLPAPAVELQRCKFITARSDPFHVTYHDQEWGVPVHDDRKLFELLVLSGFQVELSWTTILHKRDIYRSIFCDFDASAVAKFTKNHVLSLEADRMLSLQGRKVRGVVENAQRIMEVTNEFGSWDEYLWGFLNKQPIINHHRYPKQMPVKTSKAEYISKDLVKRGFRFVGPTIVYSFMQAAGMVNDHLVQCFRHQECTQLASPASSVNAIEANQDYKTYQVSYYQQGKMLLPCTDVAIDSDTGDEMSRFGKQEPLMTYEEWPPQPTRILDFSLEDILSACNRDVLLADNQELLTAKHDWPQHVPEISKDDVMEPREQECHDSEVV